MNITSFLTNASMAIIAAVMYVYVSIAIYLSELKEKIKRLIKKSDN